LFTYQGLFRLYNSNMLVCKQCNTGFEIAHEDREFYEKMKVPEPTWCPLCRMQRRMTFRNERNLYRRKCDFSGKDIISIYPPNSPFKIYDQQVWWSDVWDAMDFGRDYDFSRPFFEQFKELMRDIPRISLQNRNNENSEYCNDSSDMRNCYLCFNSGEAEGYYYSSAAGLGRDCMDLFWSMGVELCYECTKTHESYHSFWCFNCKSVSDCYFCEDCMSCKNCFGCVNLRQKEYCIYNEQKTKEEFEAFLRSFGFTYSSIQQAKGKLADLRLSLPCKNLQIHNSENCVGDYISDSKNCTECFDVMNSENLKYVWDGILNNSYDCFNVGMDTNFVYDSLAIYRSSNIKFCHKCALGCSDLEYCDYCFGCDHCFGCVGLNKKKYCILNKQYKKEEYEILVPKIIEHMKRAGEYGEFFPASLSPFGYNDSMAQEYFPLTRERALETSFLWNDFVRPKTQATKNISASRLPDRIVETPEDILNWAIECEGLLADGRKCGNFFKLIPQELKFYRTHNLPVPHLCPDCRHYARKSKINPRVLFDRKCAKCRTAIKTSYSPDRLEIVYCEQCYLKEVY